MKSFVFDLDDLLFVSNLVRIEFFIKWAYFLYNLLKVAVFYKYEYMGITKNIHPCTPVNFHVETRVFTKNSTSWLVWFGMMYLNFSVHGL